MKKNNDKRIIFTDAHGRLDVVVFIATFAAGLILYYVLNRVLHLERWIVTIAIVAVMVTYALIVSRIMLIRVRMDQAGDNAYYLGLLFTLVSMAFALYDSGIDQETGLIEIQQIIPNFGIALASTITGIFLRIYLHQMRIDPIDVEAMTRLELSDAAKKVKTTLTGITTNLAYFHQEVQQRSGDLVTPFTEDAKDLVK